MEEEKYVDRMHELLARIADHEARCDPSDYDIWYTWMMTGKSRSEIGEQFSTDAFRVQEAIRRVEQIYAQQH